MIALLECGHRQICTEVNISGYRFLLMCKRCNDMKEIISSSVSERIE